MAHAATLKEAPTPSPVVAPAGRLAGKVALITGGTRGLGLAVAKAYVREGAKVVLAGNDSAELKTSLAFLKELGGEATAARIDLDGQASAEGLYTGAIRAYGKIDILVNNATLVGPRRSILDYPAADWRSVLTTNLDVVFYLSKAVLGSMIPGNTGSIINVISGVALQGAAGWGAYSVSKAGVVNLSQVLSEEVARYNVRVNCVDPGATDADGGTRSVNDVLNPFIYLGSDSSKGVTGQVLAASDWLGRSF